MNGRKRYREGDQDVNTERMGWVRNRGIVACAVLILGFSASGQAELILEYKFNETGTAAVSTGADTAALKLLSASGAETDLHGAAGSGLTGTKDDKAFDNTASTGMGAAGIGGRAHLANAAAMNGLKSLTLQGWYKCSAAMSGGARIFENGAGGTGFKLFTVGTSGLAFGHATSEGSVADSSSAVYTDVDVWVFFAVTYDGVSGTVKFYKALRTSEVRLVDTVQSKAAGAILKNNEGLAIGNLVANNRPFAGFMDNFRIYGSKADSAGALSLAELEALRLTDNKTTNFALTQENKDVIPSCYIAATPEKRVAIVALMSVMGIAFHHWDPRYSPLFNKASGDLSILASHDPTYLNLWDKPKEAAELDVKLAKGAGFDCLSIWAMGDKWHLENGLRTSIPYFEAARKLGVKICPDFWFAGGENDKDAKGNAIDKWGNFGFLLGYYKKNYDDIWLRDDAGRRVVFLMNGNPRADAYAKAMEKMCTEVPRNEICLVVQTLTGQDVNPGWIWDSLQHPNDADWFKGVDLFYSWSSRPWAFAMTQFGAIERNLSSSKRLYIPSVITSLAQCRDEKTTGGKKSVHENLGFMKLSSLWRRAIEVISKYVYIATWNDLTEDTSIMPESNHDWAFWELNRYYAEWYHTGKEPALEREKVLLFHHPQPVAGVKLPEGRLPMLDHAFLKEPDMPTTPPTDYVGVVAFLKQPATLSVQFGIDVIAKRDFSAGMHSWLIYNPRKETLDKNWTDAYPKNSSWLSVTTVEKSFSDAQVYLNVYRGTNRIDMFRSHRPIVEAAGRSDMTTVGDVFELHQR